MSSHAGSLAQPLGHRFLSRILVASSLLLAGPALAQEPDPGLPPPVPPPGPPMPPPPRPPAGQVENGVVISADFALSLVTFDVTGNSLAPTRSLAFAGSLFGGYKLDRFIFGLGLGILGVSIGQSTEGGSSSSQALTQLTLLPGIRVALLRSADRRAELYGQFDIGWTHYFFDQTPSGGSTPDINGFTFQLGPGIRYWFHPSFAFFVLPMVRGVYLWSSAGDPKVTRSTGSTVIDANLGFVGVF